jgi:hypothetical protein
VLVVVGLVAVVVVACICSGDEGGDILLVVILVTILELLLLLMLLLLLETAVVVSKGLVRCIVLYFCVRVFIAPANAEAAVTVLLPFRLVGVGAFCCWPALEMG